MIWTSSAIVIQLQRAARGSDDEFDFEFFFLPSPFLLQCAEPDTTADPQNRDFTLLTPKKEKSGRREGVPTRKDQPDEDTKIANQDLQEIMYGRVDVKSPSN